MLHCQLLLKALLSLQALSWPLFIWSCTHLLHLESVWWWLCNYHLAFGFSPLIHFSITWSIGLTVLTYGDLQLSLWMSLWEEDGSAHYSSAVKTKYSTCLPPLSLMISHRSASLHPLFLCYFLQRKHSNLGWSVHVALWALKTSRCSYQSSLSSSCALLLEA